MAKHKHEHISLAQVSVGLRPREIAGRWLSLFALLLAVSLSSSTVAEQPPTHLEPSCASTMIIAPEEFRMTALLHELHLLKEQPTTPESLAHMRALNEEAIQMMVRRLKILKINHEITPSRERALFKFVSPDEQARAAGELTQLKRSLADAYRSRVSATNPTERKQSTETIRKLKLQIAKCEALANSRLPLLERDLAFRMRFVDQAPMIQILAGKSLPVEMNGFLKIPGNRIFLSAYEKSDETGALARATDMSIYYPIEEIFSGSLGKTRTFPHEREHVTFERASNNGEEHPYLILVTSDSKEIPIPIYTESFSFQELYTYAGEIKNLEDARYSDPIRVYKDGKIYVNGSKEAVRYQRARFLLQLSDYAHEIRRYMEFHVVRRQDLFEITIFRKDRALVTVPWIKNGHVAGEISVQVMNLPEPTEAAVLKQLHGYLERVHVTIDQHRDDALRILRDFDFKSPGPALVRMR